MKTFGSVLKEVREAHGLSRDDVALVRMPESRERVCALAAIEDGSVCPRRSTLCDHIASIAAAAKAAGRPLSAEEDDRLIEAAGMRGLVDAVGKLGFGRVIADADVRHSALNAKQRVEPTSIASAFGSQRYGGFWG
jgi:hypothetical protein